MVYLSAVRLNCILITSVCVTRSTMEHDGTKLAVNKYHDNLEKSKTWNSFVSKYSIGTDINRFLHGLLQSYVLLKVQVRGTFCQI